MAMEEVGNIAMEWYGSLPKGKKAGAKKLFKRMDKDGDQKITCTELLKFCEANPQINVHERNGSWLVELFKYLDKDENGSLDFTESITLYYLLCCGIFCANCNVILNGRTYRTCVPCFRKKPSYDLCDSCYPRKKSEHPHQNFEDMASFSLGKSSPESGINVKLLKTAKSAAPGVAMAAMHALPDGATDALADVADVVTGALAEMCIIM